MDFVKYHGLANDFMIVHASALWQALTEMSLASDGIDREALASPPLSAAQLPYLPSLVSTWCARHTGVGADGVLVAVPPASHPGAAWRMVIYNADGSRPEMCGNGLRCFARWLVEERHLDTHRFDVATDAGTRTCVVTTADANEDWDVEIGLGPIAVGAAPEVLEGDGEAVELVAADAGNPHAVVRVDTPNTMVWAKRLGEMISHHERFPSRTNAEFAYLRADQSVELTVFERGCGITHACGTGAGATATVLVRSGALPADTWISVDLPGGRCQVWVPSETSTPVRLRGPATRVFRGRLSA